MTSTFFWASGLLLLVAAGCKPAGSDPAARDAAAALQSSTDAGPSASQQEVDPIVDLIHTVEATVATSSRVDNAHDHPEHLVDGKQETAWNSKTGDIHGWIAFRLPKATRITRVDLTAGFDKRTPDGDLFTMNHRIKRVRLSRDGAELREATLDTETRTAQGIDVDAPGGDFKLEVLETVPGTKKAWRELTVSEFRVWGRAGAAPRNPIHLPKLAVGSLDGVPPPKSFPRTEIPRGPFATIAELCTAVDHVVVPLLQEKFGEGLFPDASRCKKREQYGLEPSMFQGGPFEDAAFIDVDELEQDRTSLALKTSKGWFRTDVHVRSRHHMDPGCGRYVRDFLEAVELARTATGQQVAIVRTVERETGWGSPQSSENATVWTESAYACRLDAADAPSCEGPKLLATTRAPLPVDFRPEDAHFVALDRVAAPWTARKKATLGAAGDLRVD